MTQGPEVPPNVAPASAERAQNIDEATLRALRPFLFGYAMSLVRDEDKADDLVQDTYERALKSKEQFQPGSDLRAWLTTILFRRNIELKRRDKFWNAGNDPEVFYSKLKTGASQEHELSAKQLQALLSRLSPDHAQILELLGKEYDYQEIANTLGIALNTVKSRTNRARKAFAKVLLESGYIDTDNATVERFLDKEPGEV